MTLFVLNNFFLNVFFSFYGRANLTHQLNKSSSLHWETELSIKDSTTSLCYHSILCVILTSNLYFYSIQRIHKFYNAITMRIRRRWLYSPRRLWRMRGRRVLNLNIEEWWNSTIGREEYIHFGLCPPICATAFLYKRMCLRRLWNGYRTATLQYIIESLK